MMSARSSVVAPFRFPPALFSSFPRSVGAALRAFCESALAFPSLNAVYRQARAFAAPQSFCERVLQSLDVLIDVSTEDLRRIPAAGPLVVVANHPFGGVDGLILMALLQRARPDVRLLVNYLLHLLPEMRETCFFVDPFGGPTATAGNRGAMKSALSWVRSGGVLAVFPAGEVSHFTLGRGCVSDPRWEDSAARLVRRTRATVLPVFFSGGNSRLFQLAGLLHPRLRTAMLPRELLRMRGQSVRVAIGSAIPFSRVSRFLYAGDADNSSRRDEAARLTEYLRVRTYILKGRGARDRLVRESHLAPRTIPRNSDRAPAPQPIIAALPPDVVSAEVEALPAAQCLSVSGSLRVLFGSAQQLPNVLREIGRLRESTFRLVGEGTGREIDLDRFDEHYLHLFVWNAAGRHIVGAYRMGQTDVLLRRFGAAGLYTSTLFRYRPRLLEQLTPALELGRSFVIPEYQRDYSPLSLLWKGIGRFVALHPRYRRLFGAVSISDEFQSMTKQLLMSFLKLHSFDTELAALVQPRNPPKVQRFRDADDPAAPGLATLVSDVADVEELVGEIESNRRGVPVLLRQYLKLNAKLLGFNIDPDFGDVLDGLVLIDLTTTERPILNRYLGKDGAAAFQAFHGSASAAQQVAQAAASSAKQAALRPEGARP
jgi:putative hemolysin